MQTFSGFPSIANGAWIAPVPTSFMPPDAHPAADLAHVLYMDIVGYSLLPPGEQMQLVEELNDLVREAAEASRAGNSGELLRLPTGDGMALVYFRDFTAPVECAIRLAQALRSRSYLRVRMGLHSGPVYRVQDINANANAAGSGINVAQQVMAFGDAGHILLSPAIKELLEPLRDWSRDLHDLGEHADKHGRPLQVFNLYTGEIGNPAVPRCLAESPSPLAAPAAGTRQVVLLYQAGVEPDENLARALEADLQARGCRLFLSRPPARGLGWVTELVRRLGQAEAVILLLSAASAASEMLESAVQTVRDAPARILLLPVRVRFEGALPESLATLLAGLPVLGWDGAADDRSLLAAVAAALGMAPAAGDSEEAARPAEAAAAPVESREPSPAPTVPERSSYPPLTPIGALPVDSPLYVPRPTDALLAHALRHRDSIVLIHGARQMGKTSLLARGLHQARADQDGAGGPAAVVHTDFQRLNAAHLESAEALLRTLARWLARGLGLDVSLDSVWDPLQGPSLNFTEFMVTEVLGKIRSPVVWGLDEVDRLFPCPFSSEVFGLFRTWHNERAFEPGGPWSRLTLAIAYATEAHLFITDLNQSPFNVGTRIALRDFTREELEELNRRYASPLTGPGELERFHELTGGHPYLSNRGLYALAGSGSPGEPVGLEALEAEADRDDGLFGDHLRRMLILLASEPELRDAVRGILGGEGCPDPASFYRLRSAGVVAGDSARVARPRCRIYERYLAIHLT